MRYWDKGFSSGSKVIIYINDSWVLLSSSAFFPAFWLRAALHYLNARNKLFLWVCDLPYRIIVEVSVVTFHQSEMAVDLPKVQLPPAKQSSWAFVYTNNKLCLHDHEFRNRQKRTTYQLRKEEKMKRINKERKKTKKCKRAIITIYHKD